jgi:hypothetical protein
MAELVKQDTSEKDKDEANACDNGFKTPPSSPDVS